MDKQNFNKEFQYTLAKAFKKIDEFRFEFQQHFCSELFGIAQKQHLDIPEAELRKMLLVYSHEVFSCAESVLDKDKNYSDFRLEEELHALTVALKNTGFDNELAQQTHRKAKEIIVDFFPDLIDLSGNGFRLLEKYCLLYNREFVRATENRMGN